VRDLMPRLYEHLNRMPVGCNGPNGTGIGCRFEKRWIGHRRTLTTTDRTWNSIRPSRLPLSWYLGSSRRSRQSSRSRSGFDFIGLHAASEKITNSQVRNRLRRSESRRRAPSGTLVARNGWLVLIDRVYLQADPSLLQFSMTCAHSSEAGSFNCRSRIRCKARGLCRDRRQSIYIFSSVH
jgi:hypothetical protein